MRPIPITLVAATLLCAGSAQATLFDRGGGLVYDDLLNVTWLQDANLPQTSGVSADGLFTWAQAKDWAANLSYADSARGVTWSDWRLPVNKPIDGVAWNLAPTTDGTSDWTYNGRSPQHELEHLTHVSLGNESGFTVNGTPRQGVSGVDYGLVNTGPFKNFIGYIYWTGTVSPWYPADHALNFLAYSGGMGNANVAGRFHATAVRDGDVAAVPEPGTWALMLGGVLGLGMLVRRRGQGH
jgi:hypothetical protein